MGEWSKSIGEKGEKIVKFVFEEILEFNSLIENTSIKCIKGEQHKAKTAKKNKTTHGLDGLIYVKSQIEDGLLDTVVISSKYTTKYPENPKSLFKSHLQDLAFSVECFKNSKENSDINQKFNSINKTELTGVLVWLSNEDDIDFDLNSKVNNITIDNKLLFDKIIFLDNSKVNFLFQSIYRVKEIYGKENVSFIYHNSSLNYNSLQLLTYGKSFPINYFYSNIIPMRVEKNNSIFFILFINDDFSTENFAQILSFSKTFDHLNSIEKTIINYKSFDNLINEKSIKDVLVNFQNYSLNKNLIVTKFPIDYRSI
ncbi:hypothetical protein LNJ05_12385 [Tenacibaculum finnmarkense genomovar ulcerans]|uniref:GapS4a family protein n=1 Tax=Tenacibaculum finnmarkense TaxID=2781243 RepID=UPI001E634C67|nr:hypothetical protein [Tenacibaculum finnmarkense]MCD8433560.1 hypothetical protein [Tenacibaculum finnmarkense genomovar ulcerans]